ncbi:hypothetical protein VMY22_3 [Bacillus phage VMY22]|uniref:Uncharacterized protein n=1 Tax=Bacillus phage VMY22 TaxID=1734382 RepID=A0A0N9RZJ0_9CAUD|nr:hypothetical protein VMY22_3 [Bacillus phage VMY22]ALH46468.1 hypothetical protein VMY22_3 [Bacillus phage VMY22]
MENTQYEVRLTLKDAEGKVSEEIHSPIGMTDYIKLMTEQTKEIVNVKMFVLPIIYQLKDYKDLPFEKIFITNGVLVKYDGEYLRVSLDYLNWNLIGEGDEWYYINSDKILKEAL